MSDNGQVISLSSVPVPVLVQELFRRHVAGAVTLSEDTPRLVGQQRKRHVFVHGDPGEVLIGAKLMEQAACNAIMGVKKE